MSENNTNNGGIGFIGLLTIAFVVLKLTHVIDWSWWWVLSPSLISLGLCVIVFLAAFLFFLGKGRS